MIDFDGTQRALGSMKQERQSFDSHWLELQDFFLPRRGRWLSTGKSDSEKSRGNKMNQKLVDPTPRFAVRTAAAGIHAGSTNPSLPWFKLTTSNNELNESPGVSQWLYTVEQLMRDVFERSNLYSVLPTMYGDGIVFGTAPMTVLEHPTRTIHCVPSAIGSYYLATNYDGAIDTKYCEYKMTTTQMVAQFGDKCPTSVKTAAQNKQKQQYFDVLHVIEPNDNRIEGSFNAQNMPFRSAYMIQDSEQTVLKESGFEDNPLCVLRWETTEITDPYGSSPGMDALGCAKAMQLQQKRKAQAIDKHIDPPMVGDPALQSQPSTLLPAGITYAGFTANGSAPKFQPAYLLKPELGGILQDIEDIRDLVNQAMYVDLFLAITRADPRNASVPEIAARREEQILGLGPMLQNHRDGIIKPLIDRTFYIMMRQGRLPPPPPELEGVELKVEMIGMLAQALKSIQTSGIERLVGFSGMIAKLQADSGSQPTIMDKLDTDQFVDEMALALGTPPTLVRSDEMVAQIREQRAAQEQAAQQAAQAEQMAAAAKDGASAAKTLSETPLNGGTALEAVAA